MNILGYAYAILIAYSSVICFDVRAQTKEDMTKTHIENIALSKVKLNRNDVAICYQYGCKKIARISIDEDSWLSIVNIFNDIPPSAAYERALLAEYIARMEQYVGRKTNTQFDRAGTFVMYLNIFNQQSNQMDCIDESINTLSYLKLLTALDVLNHHYLSGVVTRAGFISGYPHTAVLLVEKLTNKKYVIDSWFFDNGRPAVIVPYDLWKQGWAPDKALH